MKLSIFTALASCLAVATAYPIKATALNCRSGPGSKYALKKTYKKGVDIKISCQTTGESVNGHNLWDKTQDGCYVSDWYVVTGTGNYVAPKCDAPKTCSAPRSNTATVNLIAEFEGFRANVYRDPVGLQTVGYGHLCQKKNCAEVKYPIPLSKANGKKLLADDMKPKEKCVKEMLNSKAKLNANQYGAVVSWAYNVGCGAAKSSTLVSRLNKGQNVNTVLSAELPKWNKGGGKVLAGLVRRRKAEVALAKKSTSTKALPVKC